MTGPVKHLLPALLVLACLARIDWALDEGRYGWAVAFGVSLGFVAALWLASILNPKERKGWPHD